VHPSSLSSHHERAWLANSSSGPTCSAPPAQAATRDLARTEDGWNSCCSTQRKDGGSPARRNELHSSWWRRGRRRDLLGEQEHWETGVLNSCELATASCWPRPPAPVVACFPRRTTAAAATATPSSGDTAATSPTTAAAEANNVVLAAPRRSPSTFDQGADCTRSRES
jgi:hypothetical protein